MVIQTVTNFNDMAPPGDLWLELLTTYRWSTRRPTQIMHRRRSLVPIPREGCRWAPNRKSTLGVTLHGYLPRKPCSCSGLHLPVPDLLEPVGKETISFFSPSSYPLRQPTGSMVLHTTFSLGV